MKIYLVCLLSVIFLFLCYDCQDLRIDPFPIAEVTIGKPLTLTCIYTGNNTPVIVTWFLGNDTVGMIVSKATCLIIGTPGIAYEVSRYAINCSQLTIKQITENDIDDHWGCTVAFTLGTSPNVSNTVIKKALPTTTPPPTDCKPECVLGHALGVGLGNDAICIICLIFIVNSVKRVIIQAKDELQKPKPRGSYVTITASVHGFCKSSVKWTGPHGKIKAIKGKYDKQYNRKTGLMTLKISNLEINDSGLYTCHAKSSCGSLAQDSVRISVYEQLAVDIDIGETLRKYGSDVEIICSVYGSENKSVSWMEIVDNFEKLLTNERSFIITPYESNTNKSSLTIRTSMTPAEVHICQVAFGDSRVSVKIYIRISIFNNVSFRVFIEKIMLLAPASDNESREWIGLQGETLTNTAKYAIMSCDSNTKESHLTIKDFSVNDNGCYTYQPKNSSKSKNSIRVSINDATDHRKDAITFILLLGFGIICVACIACIVILLKIGEQCALKLGLGLGLGLGIPFVGCIIVIVILVKKVLKPQTPPPETRKTKSGEAVQSERSDMEMMSGRS